jgi:hypothetical protein
MKLFWGFSIARIWKIGRKIITNFYTRFNLLAKNIEGWYYVFIFISCLGKVEDEEHLFFVCPNTQKVRKHFCSALPLTHTSTLVELTQITNMVALAKFVACCQYQRTICPPWSAFHLMDSLVPNGSKIFLWMATTLGLHHKNWPKQHSESPTLGEVINKLLAHHCPLDASIKFPIFKSSLSLFQTGVQY